MNITDIGSNIINIINTKAIITTAIFRYSTIVDITLAITRLMIAVTLNITRSFIAVVYFLFRLIRWATEWFGVFILQWGCQFNAGNCRELLRSQQQSEYACLRPNPCQHQHGSTDGVIVDRYRHELCQSHVTHAGASERHTIGEVPSFGEIFADHRENGAVAQTQRNTWKQRGHAQIIISTVLYGTWLSTRAPIPSTS